MRSSSTIITINFRITLIPNFRLSLKSNLFLESSLLEYFPELVPHVVIDNPSSHLVHKTYKLEVEFIVDKRAIVSFWFDLPYRL